MVVGRDVGRRKTELAPQLVAARYDAFNFHFAPKITKKNRYLAASMEGDKKIFYSMGEVSALLDVSPSLLRFWEGKFDVIRPQKNAKGNRLFSPRDVENLKLIHHLVKERGMTLAGARKVLRGERTQVEDNARLLERLQTVRSLLVEIREELGEEQGEVFRAAEPLQPTAAEALKDNAPRIVEQTLF